VVYAGCVQLLAARICAATLPGKYTAAEIAKATGLRED
jgi:hypothetical protein